MPSVDFRLATWRVSVWRWLCVLRREIDEGGLDHRAMGLVYTSLLSLAPLLAVSFSLLKAFGVHNQLQPFLLKLLAPLGDKAADITTTVIAFVDNIQVGVLGFVGMATLFYTVISLLQKIEESFNHIWRVARSRPLLRRFTDYLSVVLVGPVLLFSALGLTASMQSNAVVQQIVAQEPFGTAYYLAGIILPYLLITAAFAFFYVFIPNTRVGLRPALIGGVAAGAAWQLTGWLFAAFVADSAQYSAIYSGFAVVLVFMIWLYVGWFILLLGGSVAFHCQYPRYLRCPHRQPRLSMRSRERLGLLLMYLIGLRHVRGDPAWTRHALADAVDLPWEAVDEVLSILHRAHLLLALDWDAAAYVLGRDTDAITVGDILAALRDAGENPSLPAPPGSAETGIARLLDGYDGADAHRLKARSLRDLLADTALMPEGSRH